MPTFPKRLIVGLSGVSCGGKTTVTKLLKSAFPWASVVHQDEYFHPPDSKHHVFMPDLKHHNWELKTALDFPRMEKDLKKICDNFAHYGGSSFAEEVNKTCLFLNDKFVKAHRASQSEVNYFASKFSPIQLILLEGHIIFHHDPFYKLCNLRYFFTLDEEECRARRRLRVYNPPNPHGFFDKCVWPAYINRLSDVRKLPEIYYIDAKRISLLNIYQMVLHDILITMERWTATEEKEEQKHVIIPITSHQERTGTT